MRRRGTFAAGGLVGVIALVGCGLFDLRDPEDPNQGTQTRFLDPVRPHVVLKNLAYATEARDAVNYRRSWTDDYVFRFDPFDVIVDSTWTAERDFSAINTLLNNYAGAEVSWAPRDSEETPDGGFIYRNLGYRLVLRRSATDTVAVSGLMTLYLRQTNTLWYIYRWADLNNGQDPFTWGFARLNPDVPQD